MANSPQHFDLDMYPQSALLEAEKLQEFWSPKVIGELDDTYIKVAKLRGTLCWHQHDDEDELFLVLKGELQIQMVHTRVDLKAGDFYVVPKGVPHNPAAEHECLVMLIEKKSTKHTGDVVDEKTRSIEEQLK